MSQSYHYGRFEFFVAIIVIALISLAGLSRYLLLAEDARVLRLEMLSHRFMTAAANVRVEYLLNVANKHAKASQRYLLVDNKALHFSPQAWPVSLSDAITDDYRVSEQDCVDLWQLLLQNPAPLSRTQRLDSSADYQLLRVEQGCRFQLTDGLAYFDYYPLEGRLNFVRANTTKDSNN